MPKSNKKKTLNSVTIRTMIFSCGKEAVQGPISRMELMRKLHEKTCDICPKSNIVNISGDNTDSINGISSRYLGFKRINEYMNKTKN